MSPGFGFVVASRAHRQQYSHASAREMKLGRLSFNDVLGEAPKVSVPPFLAPFAVDNVRVSKDSYVFFCGAAALGWKVQLACATYDLQFFPGHRFSSEGRIACHRFGKCNFVCMCSKFPLCCCY